MPKLTFSTIFIRPRSIDPDHFRREYVLNVLQAALGIIAALACALSIFSFVDSSQPHHLTSLLSNLVFFSVIFTSICLSRSGHYRISRVIFLSLLSLVAVQILAEWGFMLPEGLLFMAMLIVVFGVLIGARAALYSGMLVSVGLLAAAYAQLHGYLHVDTDWLSQPFYERDAIGYTIILAIIGVVTWLSNREIDRSLSRARQSEAALAAERDSLEIKVIERTQELEHAQLKRTMELQRFAEFGRVSANLLHEVANPLTSASLNLELMTDDKSSLVRQARSSLQQLERYVEAARKQLKQESSSVYFSPRDELQQLIIMLKPYARQHQVKLAIRHPSRCTLYGDPVKFAQACNNLLINAIEAYDDPVAKSSKRTAALESITSAGKLTLRVKDHGTGIERALLSRIFEPLYSSKLGGRGMGIGLALVKQVVEQDFGGKITVTSSPRYGTCFSIVLPTRRDEKST